jgi:predicted metal-binding membrane protein
VTKGLANRAQDLGWRHPEWWVVLVAGGAWLLVIVQPHLIAAHVAMISAMMLPLTIPSLRHVAFSSLWNRRYRAMVIFTLGYSGVWLISGLVILAIVRLVEHEIGVGVQIVTCGAALLWETVRAKKVLTRRCRLTVPLRARGWKADTDCLAFGTLIGFSCVGSCWALMAAAVALTHSALAMATAFLIQVRAVTGASFWSPLHSIRTLVL